VLNFLFLTLQSVQANDSQNYNGTYQRHNQAVCFSKYHKITVSCSKFSPLVISVVEMYTKITECSRPTVECKPPVLFNLKHGLGQAKGVKWELGIQHQLLNMH
jgi:hypothetical protein